MAEGAGGRTLPVPGGTTCGEVVVAPTGKTPKTKGTRRKIEGAHWVLPDREEVVNRGRQRGHHAHQTPWLRV